jgi:hypothetical protein
MAKIFAGRGKKVSDLDRSAADLYRSAADLYNSDSDLYNSGADIIISGLKKILFETKGFLFEGSRLVNALFLLICGKFIVLLQARRYRNTPPLWDWAGGGGLCTVKATVTPHEKLENFA